MQALELDFCRSKATPRWIAPALLALAVAFCGDVAFSFYKLTSEVKKQEAELARLEPRNYNRAARAAPAEEVAAARETMARLSTPWDKLFGALESAASDKIALLAIEPDPKAGSVTISGDSQDYLAALTYVLNLSRTDALSHVQLSRHEARQNDPQKPVAFSVTAGWGKP